jgi:hypothetical protein
MGVYFAPPNSSFGHVDVLGRLLERAFVNVSHAISSSSNVNQMFEHYTDLGCHLAQALTNLKV